MASKHWMMVGGAVAYLRLASVIALILTVTLQAHAQERQKDLAYPGFSGFLNVPSSTVLNRGQGDVQWSDQAFLSGREGFEQGRYSHLNNVSGSFGIFPNIEVGGRLVWDKTQTNLFTEGDTVRDLSANLKVQAPFIPEQWFTLAAGAQDLGGETGDFEALYVVAGRQVGPVEIALGYGSSGYADRYLDGAFGAISYRPFSWLNLMVEHDGQDARAGIGLTSPRDWLPYGLQVKGKVLAWDKGDTDNDRRFASLGLSIPFGNARDKQRLPSGPEPLSYEFGREAQVRAATQTEDELQSAKASARQIGQQLVDTGYDRVRTASDGQTLRIWWENNLYNRDERDSILEVAHKAHYAGGGHDRAELTLLNQGLPVVTQTVTLTDKTPYSVTRQFSELGTLLGPQEPEWDFEGSYGPTWKPRLTLSPSISSGVATEYGVWDASLALSSELEFSLWPGALASARYDAEMYQTDDFERGGVFYSSRQKTGLVEAEIQQAFKLHPQLFTAFHLGRYATDYDGGFNETLMLSPGGRHTFGVLAGTFQHKDYNDRDRTQALAQYSYYNPGLDAQFTVYGGQFFAEDQGFRVDSRFWFGDYALTLQYKNTDAEFVSLGWVIPLTPVRDHQFRYLQVRGDADWNYAVQTRINEDRNALSFGGAGLIRSSNPLQEVYLNRGRIDY